MKNNKFKYLEHMADIKLFICGTSLNEIFENTAIAFSDYIASGKRIAKKKKISIEIKANDIENLLYQFIDELIYLLDAKSFAISRAKVKIKENNLHADLFGDSTKKYNLNHVKAATYAEMYIKNKSDKNWESQVVLDV